MGRFARENRPPGEYLSMSYYQLWFAALENMPKERGLVATMRSSSAISWSAEAGQAGAVA